MSIEQIIANPALQRSAQQAVQVVRAVAPEASAAVTSKTLPDVAALAVNASTGASHGPSMGLGKAALAVVAGLVLFFVLGPKALKLAAKGAMVFARALFNPQSLGKLVNNGLFIMAAAETALPVLRKFGLSKNVTSLASKATSLTSLNGMASMASDALPQARAVASELLKQAPPALRQNAEGLLAKVANVVNELKALAQDAVPQVIQKPPISPV